MKRGHPGARIGGARVGIGVMVYLHLAAARGAWAQDAKLPVPWPTSPNEVIPYPSAAPAPKAKTAAKAAPAPAVAAPPEGEPRPAPRTPAAGAADGTSPTTSTSTSTSTSTDTSTRTSANTPTPAEAPAAAHTHLGALGDGLVFIDRGHDVDGELRRLMATLSHSPAGWLRFTAEAGIENNDAFGVQRAVVEVSPAPVFGVRVGLLLLPLGIINQLNAPPTYLTVDRPLTDQLIIPTIWRELGGGIFGEVAATLRYEVDVVAGLNGAGFAAPAPLAGGRGNGHDVAINGAALAARLELLGPGGFAMGGSGYYGSASGGQQRLDGVSVAIVEGDARFRGSGFDLRAEYAQVFISNSYRINDYLGLLGQDAVPKTGRGSYVQAGYDVLRLGDLDTKQELLFFGGYENVNPRSAMSPYNYNPPAITGPGETPPNAPSPSRSFVRGGIVYRPLPALAFKADIQIALDGEGAPPTTPLPAAGAPGAPRPLDAELAASVRGKSRLGLAIGFAF